VRVQRGTSARHGNLTAVAALVTLSACTVWWLWPWTASWLCRVGAVVGLVLAALHARDALAQSRATRASRAAFAAVVLGAIAIPAPEAARLIEGARANPRSFPPVAGPGDRVRLFFPDYMIFAISSRWRGTAYAKFTSATALGLSDPRVSAATRDDSWGDSINTTRANRNSRPTLWVDVQLPNRPELARRTAELELDLNVSYPSGIGRTFQTGRARFTPKLRLQLGAGGAGARYRALFLAGSLGGAVLIVLAGATLHRLADPTSGH